MNYYVHENLLHKKTIIHRGDCKYCKEGLGLQEKEPNSKQFWHSGFTTLDDALRFAEGTGRKGVRVCYYCAKKEGRKRWNR